MESIVRLFPTCLRILKERKGLSMRKIKIVKSIWMYSSEYLMKIRLPPALLFQPHQTNPLIHLSPSSSHTYTAPAIPAVVHRPPSNPHASSKLRLCMQLEQHACPAHLA